MTESGAGVLMYAGQAPIVFVARRTLTVIQVRMTPRSCEKVHDGGCLLKIGEHVRGKAWSCMEVGSHLRQRFDIREGSQGRALAETQLGTEGEGRVGLFRLSLSPKRQRFHHAI
jgi:hypothetical protein